jgi:hypothetical protein
MSQAIEFVISVAEQIVLPIVVDIARVRAAVQQDWKAERQLEVISNDN